jgi:hypothetical protein
MFLSRRSLLRRGIGRYPYIHTFRSLAAVTRHPRPAQVRFICTIANVTPPGIFYPSLDPRSGTTARTVPILGILEIVGRYQYRYNIRLSVVIPLQGSRHGARHRYHCSCSATSILLTVRQLHYNHYPYWEPAIRKVILYCFAHHYGDV